MKEIQILIVDDDPEVLFATARIVKADGYPVLTAASGEECLKLAGEQKPDLILMDVVLPDINGVELCRRIKSDPELKSIFVVLISGAKISSDEQADGLDDGADGYITRPISNKELRARVNAMVRILKTERERDQVIAELQAALSKVKQLSGMLPICSHCKKIRDDKGYWKQIESYIQTHSETEFSHSICPVCAKTYYPDFNLYADEKSQ